LLLALAGASSHRRVMIVLDSHVDAGDTWGLGYNLVQKPGPI